ncbi:hypothetical protein D3C73_1237950 [compost metagenome]
MTGFLQVQRHWVAHDAGADKSDFSHEKILLFCAFCRSEPARDEPRSNAGIQTARVIVDDHREQARSYRDMCQIALWVLSQPRPASVVVSGLYSQPTQPW